MMRAQRDWRCDQHGDPYDCPDALITALADGRLGIIVHDGGRSMVVIAYCPWCGAAVGPTTPSHGGR